MRYKFLIFCFIASIILQACAIRIIRKAPKDRPFLIENNFELKGGNFSKLEKEAVLGRLENQLDDSAKVTMKSPLFFLDILKKPLAFDTGYAGISARNMKASMYALGYYSSTAIYRADTSDGLKVKVKYTVDAGKQTLIDTFRYRLSDSALQQLAQKSKEASIVKENNPITKGAVLGEINRLVDTFRNNGYYKFTAAELRMRGDTTIAALTQISDDPFEQLEILAQAQAERDKPHIKLEMAIDQPEDSTKLDRYTLDSIFVLEDYRPGDALTDNRNIIQERGQSSDLIFRYHNKYLKNSFLARNILLRPGAVYSQNEFYKTVNNLTKAGVWQSVNIRVQEKDSSKLNMILELLPGKKFGFETSLEASYSATSNSSNPLGSNLFGLSLNLSLTNRNIAKQAIKMTHSLRAGIELNSGSSNTAGASLINSNELTYTNNILYPGRVSLLPFQVLRKKAGESFINTRLSLINRLALFQLQSFSTNFGTAINLKANQKLTLRPFNAELNYLNKSDSFNKIIDQNPFLRYSYTTSFILGTSASYSSIYNNPRHLQSLSKERSFRANIEESGLTWGAIPIFRKYKSKYIRTDAEYKYTVNYRRTALVLRGFVGVGIPLVGDTSLPFFKQYFGGGSNSMRAWPIRGIGRGSQKLAPYGTVFNDRTGDIQVESNVEYRYDIARIIPNTLTLRGAVFADIGNIWNYRSTLGGTKDSAQFKFKNLYRDLGMAVGTGFRLDFNYVVVRVDLGFRVKRPERAYIDNGWKLPPIQLGDLFGKIFTRGKNDVNRRWRYENFNLTFGISYPF